MPLSSSSPDKSTPGHRRRRWSAVWSSGTSMKETVLNFENSSLQTETSPSPNEDTKRKRRTSMFAAMGTHSEQIQVDDDISPLNVMVNYYGKNLVRYRKSNDLFKRILNTGQYLHIYFTTFTILSLNHGLNYILHIYPRSNSGRNIIMPLKIADNGNMTEDDESLSKYCIIRYPIKEIPPSLRVSIIPLVNYVDYKETFIEERDNEHIADEDDELLSEPPLMTDILHLDSKSNRDIPLIASSNGVIRLYMKPPFDKNYKKPIPLGILTLRLEYKPYPDIEVPRCNNYHLLKKRRKTKRQEQVPDPQGFAIASNSILVERRRRRNSTYL